MIGLLQGFSELFPISSLGHARDPPGLLGWDIHQNDDYFLAFLVAMHLATALVLLGFFWQDWVRIVAGSGRSLRDREIAPDDTDARLGWLLVVGTIPAGLLGLLLEHPLRNVFASPPVGRVLPDRQRPGALRRRAAAPPRRRAPTTGSATTTRASRASAGARRSAWAPLRRCAHPGLLALGRDDGRRPAGGPPNEAAARFAFLLATPIIGAAAVLKMPDLLGSAGDGVRGQALVGALCAAVTAWLADPLPDALLPHEHAHALRAILRARGRGRLDLLRRQLDERRDPGDRRGDSGDHAQRDRPGVARRAPLGRVHRGHHEDRGDHDAWQDHHGGKVGADRDCRVSGPLRRCGRSVTRARERLQWMDALPPQGHDDRAGAGAPRPLGGHPRTRAPRRAGHPAAPALPRGHGDRHLRDGLLLGPRAGLLAGARRLHHRRGLCRRPHPERHLRGGVLRTHRPHRGGPGRLRPRRDLLRGAAAAVLGGPRPHPGHAAGQRRRDPVPLGDLLDLRGPARRRRDVSRRLPGDAVGRGLRRHHHRDRRGGALLLRRGLPPAVPREEPQRLLRHGGHGASAARSDSAPRPAKPPPRSPSRRRVAPRRALVGAARPCGGGDGGRGHP